MVLKRSVFFIVIASSIVFAVFGISRVMAADNSVWLNASSPTVLKSIELPANVSPNTSNMDCSDVTVRPYASTAMKADCVTSTRLGLVGSNGIVFNGSPTSVRVDPIWPLFNLDGIPNSGITMTYSIAPVTGLYLHFYSSLVDKIDRDPQWYGGSNGYWRYQIKGSPERSLRDSSGKLLAANVNAMAFSQNGAWMVVDLDGVGFVRVKLSTMEIKPFAPSMRRSGDYSQRDAQLTINNDGTTVAVKPRDFNYFKVYDLTNCSSATLPVAAASEPCPSKDYLPAATSNIPSLKALYKPRFMNNSQLAFTAVYDYSSSSNYKVATYTLTAPGVSPTGISYLGMGDSFASGEGAYDYLLGTDTTNNSCHLSNKSYGLLTAGGKSVACSGAVVKDVLDTTGEYKGQVKDYITKNERETSTINIIKSSYLPGFLAQTEFVDQYRPEAVTLSIGGNDIGFSDILKRCVTPLTLQQTCYPEYEDRVEIANQINGIFDKLVNTYKTVLKPGKRVYVIGYPQVAKPGSNCANNVHLNERELRFAASLIDYLNQVIAKAADKAGVRYVDVSGAFSGHRMCETESSEVAVNGFTAGDSAGIGPFKFIGSESYHPNALGHRLLQTSIMTQTVNLTLPMPTPGNGVLAPIAPSTIADPALPRSGRSLNTVVQGAEIIPNLLVRARDVPVFIDSATAALRASSTYRIVMGGRQQPIGTATTDLYGSLSTNVRIPEDIPAGFQTIHVYGSDLLGQPLDITKTVYVAASQTDMDGDGIDDAAQKCVLVAPSNVDSDRDGIDDACDGTVVLPVKTRQTNSVTLTNNTISLTR